MLSLTRECIKARTEKSLFTFEFQFRFLKLRREMKLNLEVNCPMQEPDWMREGSLVVLSERAQYEEHEATTSREEKLT